MDPKKYSSEFNAKLGRTILDSEANALQNGQHASLEVLFFAYLLITLFPIKLSINVMPDLSNREYHHNIAYIHIIDPSTVLHGQTPWSIIKRNHVWNMNTQAIFIRPEFTI